MPQCVAGTLRGAALLMLLGVPIVWLRWGGPAAAGWSLGIATAIVSVTSFGMLVVVLSRSGPPQPRRATAMFSVFWLIKLPLIWLFTLAAGNLGPLASGCFLTGAVLVYCVLIGFACKEFFSCA